MSAPQPERRGPVVGRIVETHPIEQADHVRLAEVDIGRTQPLMIVFGGVYEPSPEDRVPVAPPGSWVPGPGGDRNRPVKMRRRRYRGHDSFGMLCSLRELGWTRRSGDRVAVLDPVLEPGTPLPGARYWRGVVVNPWPCADEFEPNTLEDGLLVGDLEDARRAADPRGGSPEIGRAPS